MKRLRESFAVLQGRHAALSRREKLLTGLGLVLGPLLIGNTLFIERQWLGARNQQNAFPANQESLLDFQAQPGQLQQQLAADPNAAKKTELQVLTAGIGQLDGQLREIASGLVRPEEMNGLLQGLLARQAGLRLISLKTLAPQSIVAGTTGAKAPAKEAQDKPAERVFDLYRHGVEIRLEGSYDDLQVYMAQLEKLPQRLLWGELVYRVIDYPRAEIRLTLYSLSPDKAWLAL